MEDIRVKMEECSSRIEDPTYPCKQDNEPYDFFGVFFCIKSEDKPC